MQTEKTWSSIIDQLAKKVDPTALATWFADVKLVNANDRKLTIEAPNPFILGWIKKNYSLLLEEAVANALGENFELAYVARLSAPALAASAAAGRPGLDPIPTPKTDFMAACGVSPKYSFQNFVIGRSNQFAAAACQAVAEKKARNYNPLFIYGGVGLGKTHLLNAVGNRLLERNPRLRVICIQAETFLNEMIGALRQEKMAAFRKRFRSEVDVLLMDDIEIIAGKERTQEEFFYTFNDLYLNGKKIIITSDKFPKEMTTLEERLRSRFESGIIVDIQPPEFETRLAIIKRLAEIEGLALPDEVALFMADKIKSNIRTIEGSLIRLAAVASLSGQTISLPIAEEVVRAVLIDPDASLGVEDVMKLVAAYFKLKVSDLRSPKRNRKFAVPRQMAMFLCRELCAMSYPEIGAAFGGRDHSTVIHSCRKIGIDQHTDRELSRHLEVLKKKLQSQE